MKVVLFCGGLGMRIRDNENVPKPMITIGYRPIVWHLMKYYAHFGFKDFILCLGYRADYIKNYFLTYNECVSNDFTLSEGGRRLELLKSDISDWRITFVDTGLNANIGMRLKAVEKHLAGEEYFLANYSDGLTDLPLADQLDHFFAQGKIASFLSVRPNLSFHIVKADERGRVTAIEDIAKTHLRINGGFFVFRREIFDYHARGRGARPRAVPAAGRAERATGVRVRRVLAGDGHVQRPSGSGAPVFARQRAVGSVEDGRMAPLRSGPLDSLSHTCSFGRTPPGKFDEHSLL